MVAWALVKSKEPGKIGLWSAARMVVNMETGLVDGIDIGEPEFIENAAERLSVLIRDAACDLKGQPIDRGQK